VRDPWTKEEEALLLAKAAQLGKAWKRIASFFTGRSEVSVKSHWQVMQRRTERELMHAAQIHLLGAIMPQVTQETEMQWEPGVFPTEGHCDCDLDPWFGW
jgi:hypothetical protein